MRVASARKTLTKFTLSRSSDMPSLVELTPKMCEDGCVSFSDDVPVTDLFFIVGIPHTTQGAEIPPKKCIDYAEPVRADCSILNSVETGMVLIWRGEAGPYDRISDPNASMQHSLKVFIVGNYKIEFIGGN